MMRVIIMNERKKFLVILDKKHRELIDNAGEVLHISASEVIRELIEKYTVQYVQEEFKEYKEKNESLLLIKENTSNYSA